jgi:hypothetical protein
MHTYFKQLDDVLADETASDAKTLQIYAQVSIIKKMVKNAKLETRPSVKLQDGSQLMKNKIQFQYQNNIASPREAL